MMRMIVDGVHVGSLIEIEIWKYVYGFLDGKEELSGETKLLDKIYISDLAK